MHKIHLNLKKYIIFALKKVTNNSRFNCTNTKVFCKGKAAIHKEYQYFYIS